MKDVLCAGYRMKKKEKKEEQIITSEFYPDCCVEAIYFPSAKLLASSDVTKPGFGRQLC